jgi:hypothetical protein
MCLIDQSPSINTIVDNDENGTRLQHYHMPCLESLAAIHHPELELDVFCSLTRVEDRNPFSWIQIQLQSFCSVVLLLLVFDFSQLLLCYK